MKKENNLNFNAVVMLRRLATDFFVDLLSSTAEIFG